MTTIVGNWVRAAIMRSRTLERGIVWCTECGRSQKVDPAKCLSCGWPKCCGYTMTLDSPEERGKK